MSVVKKNSLLLHFLQAKKKPDNFTAIGRKENLATTYSPTLSCAVPSAMEGLTSEFGMGSGVPPPLLSPRKNLRHMDHFRPLHT